MLKFIGDKMSITRLIGLGMAIVLCGAMGVYSYKFIFCRTNFYDLIPILIFCIIVGGCGVILLAIFEPRENLELWVYEKIQTKWEYRERVNTIFNYLDILMPILPIIPIILIPIALLMLLFWFICEGDITKFIKTLSDSASIILVAIFIVQTCIFYYQYRYMKESHLKTPLLWIFSKSINDDNCGIFLKNGDDAPIFNISYKISEILVKDRWKFKEREDRKVSKDFLSRLDGESEKKIFEKPVEEFKKMRLTVVLSAKSLDGYSTHLFFYKSPRDKDFRLSKVKYRS